MSRFATLTKVLTAFVVLALVAGLLFIFTNRNDDRTVFVDFPRTNSLYTGSDVKILGVAVGTVDKLEAKGSFVRATLTYDSDVKLPADVKAVLVSPSIVGDRFIQLAPAYSGGATLPNKARLGQDRSAVPVELDQIFASLDDLSVALGPKGANKDGALSSLVEDSARQLDGQGAQLNKTLRNFGKLSQTLSNNKDNLFGSVRQVSQFVDLLQRNDDSVRAFFDSTAQVSKVLEGERQDLQATLKALSKALIDVRSLVKDNRGALRSNIDNLEKTAATLGKHQNDIQRVLNDGPTALSNVAFTYNPDSATLDNRSNVLDLLKNALESAFKDPSQLIGVLCTTLGENVPPAGQVCDGLKGVLGGILDPGGQSGKSLGELLAGAAGGASSSTDQPDSGGGGANPLSGLLNRSGASSTAPSPDRVQNSLTDMLAVK